MPESALGKNVSGVLSLSSIFDRNMKFNKYLRKEI